VKKSVLGMMIAAALGDALKGQAPGNVFLGDDSGTGQKRSRTSVAESKRRARRRRNQLRAKGHYRQAVR